MTFDQYNLRVSAAWIVSQFNQIVLNAEDTLIQRMSDILSSRSNKFRKIHGLIWDILGFSYLQQQNTGAGQRALKVTGFNYLTIYFARVLIIFFQFRNHSVLNDKSTLIKIMTSNPRITKRFEYDKLELLLKIFWILVSKFRKKNNKNIPKGILTILRLLIVSRETTFKV